METIEQQQQPDTALITEPRRHLGLLVVTKRDAQLAGYRQLTVPYGDSLNSQVMLSAAIKQLADGGIRCVLVQRETGIELWRDTNGFRRTAEEDL